jgi:uncharacterized RDD family membrane protein YckC
MDTKREKNNIGFWRRLASQWIDVFVIYSLTKFFIVLLSVIDFRISFGALFIFIAAFYSTLMLSLQRQTIGKMLLQITVISETNDSVNLRYILLREVFGKWGITVLMPMMIGSIFFGNKWLPTVFDILIMVPVIVLCIIYFLFTKQMWYERLAGLTVSRSLSIQKVKTGFYGLLFAATLGIGTILTEYLITDRVPCHMAAFQNNNSTKPYVDFLKKQHTNPVDYVIGLFDKYDVVVLCERAHPEMTQWDFIYDIIRDPRFITKAGHVFTEYGQVGMQDYMNKFMLTDSLSETEVHDHVIHIMRNMPVWPSWTNFNLYQYLTRLYYLNQKLSPENRVQHHFTDAAVDWSSIKTNIDYKEYQKKYVWKRDEIMAKTIIEEMAHLSKSAVKPPKCLVIMNYRHAMDLTDRLPDTHRGNTYEFLKDSFGNRAANVLINTRFLISIPIASGVWDAAFEKIGNKSLGFNFQGSPFGICYFDLYPFDVLFQPLSKSNCPSSDGSLRYRDVFTGFVFTHPIKDQYFQSNTPGYYDGFEEEYIRRSGCLKDEYRKAAKLEMQSLKYESPDTIQKHIEFTIETFVELFFYCFSGVGLLIGVLAFIFKRRKMIAEANN